MMPKFAWVKNESKCPQHWGPYGVEPGAVGLIPAEAVTGRLPAGVQVVSNNPDLWLFKQTEHQPFNPRYTKR